MPSEERIARAMQALARPREAFRSAVVEAAEEVRAFLARHEGPDDGVAGRAARELGRFADGRIDADRFASLFVAAGGLDPQLRARVGRALAVLDHAVAAGEDLFRLDAEPGADLAGQVDRALARTGRVFAAAQLVELIRGGRFEVERHDDLLDLFPFRRWNRAEREIAPPLVVEVDGADLRVGGLDAFLDGAQKLVLVVRGAAPPAPLARLVSPGVFVMQATDAAELDRLAAVPGPAVAALLPEGAARFVHDPAGGPSLRARLSVGHLPPLEEGGSAPGSLSAFRVAEDLRQLAALWEAVQLPSAAPEPAAPAGSPAPATAGGDPAAVLAAWLLRQAEL